ncbi:MAG: aminotransferase class I/II-fold pyridoxal phosphate-dependent enzyme [Burkholderiaceae bacterium]|nr:MAG: aminotransferase class I/II-fold pyridoxal phosphate-dependent enzyme [Burkholderiaceae bacterium]
MPHRTETLLQHGDALPGDDSSIAPPIHPSATFRAADAADFADMAGRVRHPRYYTRYGNPTLERVAQLVAGLEGGEAALLASSGMGAISATLIGLLRAGDHVVAQRNHYMGTTRLLGELLPRYGVGATFVDQTSVEAFELAIRPETRLLMIETPANPTLALTDLEGLARLAQARGVLTVADNTFASPINQKPLAAGIDIVVHSATKSLGGHHDLTAGAVVARRALIDRIWDSAIVLGSVLGPHDAWLLLRGLRTLSVRVERSNQSALAIARWLQTCPGVDAVFYPGLEQHPQHALACRQMSGFGSVIALRVRGGYRGAEQFMSRLALFAQAVSLGGVESLAVHAAAMWSGSLSEEAMRDSGIEPDLIRLSIGLEHVDDLIADLGQALSSVA